tara:strand:- start:76 stop:192 length:117 start_codon:yes stop_codon:yes gene_type:complete
MDKGWLQLLLVGVPVLMFIGAWMTLRHVSRRPDKRKDS